MKLAISPSASLPITRDLTLAYASSLVVAVLVALVSAVVLAFLTIAQDAGGAFVTALVGGPHVFATFTATFANKNFRRRNPWLIASSTSFG